MTIYNDVFGGANIYPSEISYSAYALTDDVTLSWPEETSTNTNLATRIIDITSATAAWAFTLPEANKTGTGNTILFNNLSAQTVTVKNAAGAQVVTVAPSELWQVYLSNNSTAAGVWRALQYGAEVSEANASSLAGTGIVAVGTLLSQSVPVTSFNANYSAGVTDRAKLFVWAGAGGTFTLPDPVLAGNNWFCYLRNNGSGMISADPAGGILINGSASISFQPGDSAIIACDGSAYYTIGFGQSAVFAFDYVSIDVSGAGDYVLAGSELNRVVYNFTGTLTGSRNVVVPDTVQQYWVSNVTTGSYDLEVKTASGLGVKVSQGERSILYSNGINVVNANTAGLALPLDVSQGGTGATTASNARLNLGGTATGVALFTAASQAAAWSVLGRAPGGAVDGGTF